MDFFEEITDTLNATSFDPNETRATATELDEGRYEIQGDGIDWYRFDVDAGEMSFTMTQDNEDRDLAMTLFNARGQAIATDFTNRTDETITFFAPEEGTYFLRIFTAQFADTPPDDVTMAYTLDLDLPAAAVSDGNDTRTTARSIEAGSYRINGSAQDWFRVDSLSGVITVDITGIPNGRTDDLNVILYNSREQVVAASQGPTGAESLRYNAPVDGEYFIKVFWAGAPNTTSSAIALDYTLDITLPEAEVRSPDNPGETLTTATPLIEGTRNVVGSGLDWFRVDVGPGEMNFAMTSTAPDSDTSVAELNMVLYDANGNQVQANNRNGGTERISWMANESGTYYLQVFAPAYPNGTPNGVAMRYTLETDLPSNTFSVPLDFGPVRTASISAYDIDNDGRDEIFIGTSKALDAEGNEIRPAGLIVLEDDGTVKWTKTFAAIDNVDSRTGKRYNTTSVSTQAVFSDVNGDGRIDVLVGVGADNALEFATPGQPGDRGGLYALDADGNELWYHETRDVFGSDLGGENDGPDGRPEGVYGTPRVFDIDADGKREVIFTSWDQTLYILDGASGRLEREFDLHDTTSTTPGIADLNGDGLFEIVVATDITDNVDAGIERQGGVLVALSPWAQPNVEGWNEQIFSTTSADFRGKFVDQALWSNPKITDIDRDGMLEIIHGTSNFFKDDRGQFIKIWNADGTEQATLATNGQTLAAPLLADLDGDGTNEIIAATTKGWVHAWNGDGSVVFANQPVPFSNPALTGEARNLPIARQPVAVDIDNDGSLELIVTIGSQNVILDSDGTQLSSLDRAERVFNTYSGSPLVRDIDGDGVLDIISGGTTQAQDQAVIYRWENPTSVTAQEFRTADYQNEQSLNRIQDFVERFYETILGRSSDPAGNNYWTDNLYTGVLAGENIARGFINSTEFQNRNTSDTEYVNTLYAAFFGRPADTGGFNAWMEQLANGADRADVLRGFTGSQEFANLTESFGIRPELAISAGATDALILGDPTDTSILRGGAGNQVLSDESAQVRDPRSRQDIQETGQVFRLYGATLGRIPDATGFLGWLNALKTEAFDIERVAGQFVNSPEFQQTYGALSDGEFIDLLYENVLGRTSDAAGRQGWLDRFTEGATRAEVVLGFSNSGEYRDRTEAVLDAFMREARVEWNDVIEGGAGNDEMNGGLGSDLFVFRAGQGGNDTIHGFEPWDQLQLSGFGFGSGEDAIAHMTQQGANVVFNHAGQAITFRDSTLAEIARARFNV